MSKPRILFQYTNENVTLQVKYVPAEHRKTTAFSGNTWTLKQAPECLSKILKSH